MPCPLRPPRLPACLHPAGVACPPSTRATTCCTLSIDQVRGTAVYCPEPSNRIWLWNTATTRRGDGVNVDFNVYSIRTRVTEQGATMLRTRVASTWTCVTSSHAESGWNGWTTTSTQPTSLTATRSRKARAGRCCDSLMTRCCPRRYPVAINDAPWRWACVLDRAATCYMPTGASLSVMASGHWQDRLALELPGLPKITERLIRHYLSLQTMA